MLRVTGRAGEHGEEVRELGNTASKGLGQSYVGSAGREGHEN